MSLRDERDHRGKSLRRKSKFYCHDPRTQALHSFPSRGMQEPRALPSQASQRSALFGFLGKRGRGEVEADRSSCFIALRMSHSGSRLFLTFRWCDGEPCRSRSIHACIRPRRSKFWSKPANCSTFPLTGFTTSYRKTPPSSAIADPASRRRAGALLPSAVSVGHKRSWKNPRTTRQRDRGKEVKEEERWRRWERRVCKRTIYSASTSFVLSLCPPYQRIERSI